MNPAIPPPPALRDRKGCHVSTSVAQVIVGRGFVPEVRSGPSPSFNGEGGKKARHYLSKKRGSTLKHEKLMGWGSGRPTPWDV